MKYSKIGVLISCLMAAFIFFTFAVCTSGAPAFAEDKAKITQYEFMVHLTGVMGLVLPAGAQPADYIKALESRGVTIPGGYKPDEFISAKQMAIMLIPAMGLDKAKFENTKKQIGLGYKDKAVIISILGDVKIKTRRTKRWDMARLGIELNPEDIIKTGAESSAVIRLGQITVAKIKENTTVTVLQLAKNPIIHIEDGDIILDARGSQEARSHYIMTPTTVVAVRGTVIEVIHKLVQETEAGVTKVIVAQGKTDVYNVSGYSLEEKIAMAKRDRFPVKEFTVSAGSYIEKDKIYPLAAADRNSINSEADKIRVAADTDLLGSASEKFLKEEGISEKEYLKIDVLENKTRKETLAKNQ